MNYKHIIILAAFASAGLNQSASGVISVISTGSISGSSGGDNSGFNYGEVAFPNVTVQKGDYLVVAHGSNKRVNSVNTISVSGLTGNTIFDLPSGNTSANAGAWVFYSSIATGGTYNISLDTTNSNDSVTQATTYWVLRGDVGEVIQVAGTASNASDVAVANLGLDFSFSNTITDGFGVAAVGTDTLELDVPPTGWTSIVNASDKRITYANDNVDGMDLNSTFSFVSPDTDKIALAGAVFNVVPVPEPSNAVLVSLIAMLGFFRRSR
jgi:hypothetical protein